MENNNSETYQVKDLGEAAALITKGVKLLKLRNGGGFYWFVFIKKEVGSLSEKYWSGELQVSAKEYYDEMRSLKDRLFAHNDRF